jgi:signal transduction histidine kinase/ActR/RegA family two-component response regulator
VNFWLKTLSAKILIGTSFAVLIASLLANFYISNTQKTSLARSFEKQSQGVVSTIAVFSIEPLLTMDYPTLEHALKTAGAANDSILFIEVTHRDTTVASYGTPNSTGRSFGSEIRIDNSPKGKIGDVFVVFSSRDHDILMNQRISAGAIATLVIFASFGIALILLLRRTVISPIQKLTLQTEQTIEQALREIAPHAAPQPNNFDEIQQLDARFNMMLSALEHRNTARQIAETALLEHKNNLEVLIEERTTDLIAAQQEATRLNKNKSDFLAAASHDLRQPIQAISLFQHSLSCSQLNEEQAMLNRNIGIALTSLNEILDTLLDISKLDSGVVHTSLSSFQAVDLFSKIEDSFALLAMKKGLRFKLWFPLKGLTLHTDPSLLFGLLRNLIDNAIKYTPSGGILVSAKRRGNTALIQVWDTGIGISPSDLNSIFDEYVQISNPERDKAKGLGLGLSIVKRISTLLGTRITCRSREGKGAVFEFQIPLANRHNLAADNPDRKPCSEAALAYDFKGKHLVLIEDDQFIAEAMRTSLEQLGIFVTLFGSGEDALNSPSLKNADFIISDHWLPGKINGMKLISNLIQSSKNPIRAVLLTGDSTTTIPIALQTAGCRLLYKPASLETLLSTLSAIQTEPPLHHDATNYCG